MSNTPDRERARALGMMAASMAKAAAEARLKFCADNKMQLTISEQVGSTGHMLAMLTSSLAATNHEEDPAQIQPMAIIYQQAAVQTADVMLPYEIATVRQIAESGGPEKSGRPN